MHANDLIVNDSGAGQAVEGVAKLFPHFDREATTAFVVKAVNSIYPGALVVAAQQEEVFGVLDLVGKEQTNYFE